MYAILLVRSEPEEDRIYTNFTSIVRGKKTIFDRLGTEVLEQDCRIKVGECSSNIVLCMYIKGKVLDLEFKNLFVIGVVLIVYRNLGEYLAYCTCIFVFLNKNIFHFKYLNLKSLIKNEEFLFI